MDSSRDANDYGIIQLRPFCNTRILKKVVHIIDYFKPVIVVLQQEAPNQSPKVKEFMFGLIQHVKDSGLDIRKYSRQNIRDVFTQWNSRSRHEIATTIVEWIPELEEKLPRKKKIWESESYNQQLFDAFSLAFTHYYLNE
jgi:hypothetical protein